MRHSRTFALLGLTVGLASSAGCAAETSTTAVEGSALRARAVDGRELLVPADQATGLLAVSPGVRVVADLEHARFLLVHPGPSRNFAIATTVACASASDVAFVAGSELGCMSPSGAGDRARVTARHYLALDGALMNTTAEQLLRAPRVDLKPWGKGSSAACGVQPADFAVMLERLATDLPPGETTAPRTPLLGDYHGKSFVFTVPTSFAVHEMAAAGVPYQAAAAEMSPDDEAFGSTCKCLSGTTGCKKDSVMGHVYCDSGSCTTCQLNN